MRKQQSAMIVLILFILLLLALSPLIWQQLHATFARPPIPTSSHNLRFPIQNQLKLCSTTDGSYTMVSASPFLKPQHRQNSPHIITIDCIGQVTTLYISPPGS